MVRSNAISVDGDGSHSGVLQPSQMTVYYDDDDDTQSNVTVIHHNQ